MQWAVGSGQWAGTTPEVGVRKAEPKIKEAASQFEALLIGQMLKSFRESGLGGEDDQDGASMLEMAEGQLAQVLAAHGGLGLSGMIVKSLKQR